MIFPKRLAFENHVQIKAIMTAKSKVNLKKMQGKAMAENMESFLFFIFLAL